MQRVQSPHRREGNSRQLQVDLFEITLALKARVIQLIATSPGGGLSLDDRAHEREVLCHAGVFN